MKRILAILALTFSFGAQAETFQYYAEAVEAGSGVDNSAIVAALEDSDGRDFNNVAVLIFLLHKRFGLSYSEIVKMPLATKISELKSRYGSAEEVDAAIADHLIAAQEGLDSLINSLPKTVQDQITRKVAELMAGVAAVPAVADTGAAAATPPVTGPAPSSGSHAHGGWGGGSASRKLEQMLERLHRQQVRMQHLEAHLGSHASASTGAAAAGSGVVANADGLVSGFTGGPLSDGEKTAYEEILGELDDSQRAQLKAKNNRGTLAKYLKLRKVMNMPAVHVALKMAAELGLDSKKAIGFKKPKPKPAAAAAASVPSTGMGAAGGAPAGAGGLMAALRAGKKLKKASDRGPKPAAAPATGGGMQAMLEKAMAARRAHTGGSAGVAVSDARMRAIRAFDRSLASAEKFAANLPRHKAETLCLLKKLREDDRFNGLSEDVLNELNEEYMARVASVVNIIGKSINYNNGEGILKQIGLGVVAEEGNFFDEPDSNLIDDLDEDDELRFDGTKLPAWCAEVIRSNLGTCRAQGEAQAIKLAAELAEKLAAAEKAAAEKAAADAAAAATGPVTSTGVHLPPPPPSVADSDMSSVTMSSDGEGAGEALGEKLTALEIEELLGMKNFDLKNILSNRRRAKDDDKRKVRWLLNNEAGIKKLEDIQGADAFLPGWRIEFDLA